MPAQAELIWRWDSDFTEQEQQKLQSWIVQTHQALETLVGPFPFDIHVQFRRRANQGEPVPWAHTLRGREQGIALHVDPAYPLDAFLNDWTAPHELSHLLIPSLGDRYSWFAEGFASYMQYQVMRAMGVMSESDVKARYLAQVSKAQSNYTLPDKSFDRAALDLHRKRQYPTLYWGGAVYFLRADHVLRERENSLVAVVREYLACCRLARQDLEQLIGEFDRLSASEVFGDGLKAIRQTPGFPPFQDLFQPTPGG